MREQRLVATTSDLGRRLAAECLGTGFLLAAIVGSGIAAQRLSTDPGLQLLQNALATAAALAVLIAVLGPVSGAHLNPAVTVVDRLLGGVTTTEAAAYLAVQVVGGVAGVLGANLMFELPAAAWSTTERAGSGVWLGELVATFGLLMVVFGLLRSGRAQLVAPSVGAYIGAAYYFTSSTSFANPAVTLARTMSDTFAGIAPGSAPAFLIAEAAGGALGMLVVRWLFPSERQAEPGRR
jgi:glycerol uptake facilitator-like aquaporin